MSGRGGMPGWDPSSGKPPDKPDFSLGGTGQSAGEYFAEKNRKVAAQKLGAVEVESDVLKGVVVHFGTDTLQKTLKEELVVRLGGEVSGFGERKTHYVVEKMTAAQVRQWRSQTRCFIVTEKWLFDTAERRTRMRESDYQLDALKNPLQHGLGAFGIGAAPPPAAAPPAAPPPATAPQRTPPAAAASSSSPRVGAGGLVLHIDVDAYFVQCHQVEEPRKYPRGTALAVQQHDDIIAANHHAKALGVRKRTAPAEARRIFSKAGVKPGLVHVPTEPTAGRVTYALYRRHSARLAALWRRLATAAHAGAVVEAHASSLDEVWIDTGTADAAAAQRLAEELRRASRDELGFDVSVGVGRNKSVAKLASCLAKPERTNRGVVAAVAPADLDALLSQTPLAALPSDGRRACCSDAVVAAVAAALGHGSGAPSLRDAQTLTADRVAALLRSAGRDDRPPRDDPDALAREFCARVRGEPVNDDDARVRERPPKESISQALSLAVVPITVAGRGRTIPVSPFANPSESGGGGDASSRELDLQLRSLVGELLDRAARHRRRHRLAPSELGLSLSLLAPRLANSAGRPTEAHPLQDRSTKERLSDSVARALSDDKLLGSGEAHEAAAEDGRMEGAVTALVAQLKGMMGRLAEKGTWNGCVARECKVKHLDVKLSKWDAVASPNSDIRNAFGGGGASGSVSGSVSGGASSGGGGGARGVKRERPPVSLDLTGDGAPAADDDDDDDEVVEVEAPPTVERLSKSASQRSDGDDNDDDDDAAGGGGGGPWYGHVRVYARAAGTPAAALSVLFSHRWRVLHATSYEGESHSLVPIHPPHLDGIAATMDKKLGPAAADVDTFCDADDGSSASALLGLRRGVGIGVAASPALARAAALHSLLNRSSADAAVVWVRDAAEAEAVVDAQPIVLLCPTLRSDEVSQLRREGVRTFAELRALGAEQLAARYGDARAADLGRMLCAPLGSPAAAAAAPPPPPPRQAAASSAASSSAAAAPRPRAAAAAAEEEDLPTYSQADPGTVEMLEAAGCKDIVDDMKRRSREKAAAAAAAAAAGATGAAGGRAERAAAVPAAGDGWKCECGYVHLGREKEFLTCKMCWKDKPPTAGVPAHLQQPAAGAPSAAHLQWAHLQPPSNRTSPGGRGGGGRGGGGRGGGGRRGKSPIAKPPRNSARGRSPPANAAASSSSAQPSRDLLDLNTISRAEALAAINRRYGPGAGVDLTSPQPPPPAAASAGDASAQQESTIRLEAWAVERPELQEQLRTGNPADCAAVVRRYAEMLLAGSRLEELGYLAAFLARECGGDGKWRALIEGFVELVDGEVLLKYGAPFAPCAPLRRRLEA